jgi:hypothetical protein
MNGTWEPFYIMHCFFLATITPIQKKAVFHSTIIVYLSSQPQLSAFPKYGHIVLTEYHNLDILYQL